MKVYKKVSKFNPVTGYYENDIVTYIDYVGKGPEVSQINIIVLDHIEQFGFLENKGDIYYKAMLTFSVNEAPYLMVASGDGSNFRNWFIEDEMRRANDKEKDMIITAMTQILQSGAILHDTPANIDIESIL